MTEIYLHILARMATDTQLFAERQRRRDDNCTSATLLGAAGGLSTAVLAGRVTGEESVDLVSEMINSTALRVSPDAAGAFAYNR